MAWEMYLRMESTHESFIMLQILANDCYRAGHFFYSLKAFDVLERLDPAPECVYDAPSKDARNQKCKSFTHGVGTGRENAAQPLEFFNK
jgi:hypothetical protein